MHKRVLQVVEKIFLIGLEIFEKLFDDTGVLRRVWQALCAGKEIPFQGIDPPERDRIGIGAEDADDGMVEFQQELVTELKISDGVCVPNRAGKGIGAAPLRSASARRVGGIRSTSLFGNKRLSLRS